VPLLQPGQPPEVGQALAFLFGHVIAVGHVRAGDGRVPVIAANRMPRGLRDRVPDLVVVADGVQGLVLHPGLAARGDPDPKKGGVEDRLLRCRMHLEEGGQPTPYGCQRLGIGPVDLLQDREQPSLLVMIVKDQLGDVHDPPTAPASAARWRQNRLLMLRPGRKTTGACGPELGSLHSAHHFAYQRTRIGPETMLKMVTAYAK